MLVAYLYDRSDARTPGFDPRKYRYPHLITKFADLLTLIGESAFRDGYTIRIDTAAACGSDGATSRLVPTNVEWKFILDLLRLCAVEERPPGSSIYPIAFWLLPTQATESVVDLFKALPFDEPIAQQLFAQGVVKFSLDDAFCQITAGFEFAPRVFGWIQSACEAFGSERVSWNVGLIEML